jgi:hypothetical protein
LEAAEPHLPAIAGVIPELAQRAGFVRAGDIDEPAVQAALRAWFGAISRERPLVFGLDDFHAFDQPSAALFALAAVEPREDRIAILATAESGGRGSGQRAQQLLCEVSTRIQLRELDAGHTHALLESLFGDVPNVGLLSDCAHSLCRGNPRDLLRLAQHLIDRGSVRYDAGAWTLPARFDADELPSSMAEALRARVAAQRESARMLAGALALCTDESFSFDECGWLFGTHDVAALQADIDALAQAEIARFVDGKLGLTHGSWVAPLLAALSPELERLLESRLAALFEQRGDREFLAAQHWLRAGEHAHGLDVLVKHAEIILRESPPVAVMSARSFHVPVRDWRETYELALRLCEQLGRPARDKYTLRSRMTSLCSLLGQHDTVQLPAMLADLARCSGLSDYSALDASLPHAERLRAALDAAEQRYAAASEHERLFEPRDAMRELVRAVTVMTGLAAVAFDLAFLRAAPDLGPFRGLAPVIAPIHMLIRGMERRLTGSLEQAASVYRELIQRIEQPDAGGLDVRTVSYTHAGMLNALGLIEAGSGLASCVRLIDGLQKLPAFDVNALSLRMLHLLFQGDAVGAEACRQLSGRARLQTGAQPIYGSGYLIWELQAHAIAEDLTRMRHTLDEIAPLADRFQGWQPILRYGSAEYHRIRRSPSKALADIEAALRLAPPGTHQVWPCAAACHVLVLHDLGRHAEALASALENLEAARAQLGEVPPVLSLVASLAEAQVGASTRDDALRTRAPARADAAIAQLMAAGVSGIRIGFAHDMRSRVAALLADSTGLQHHLELCRAAYLAHKNPALSAKYERLSHALGQRAHVPELASATIEGRVVAALERCHTPEQRAQLALTSLLQHAGSSAGALFTLGAESVECAARIGEVGDIAALSSSVDQYLRSQLAAAEVTCTHSDSAATLALIELSVEPGRSWRPVLLHHTEAGQVRVVGVAVLELSGSRGALAHPTRLASAIARVLERNGDSSLVETRG